MKYITGIIIIAIMLLTASSCTTFHKSGLSSEPMEGKKITENHGKVKGSRSVFKLLFYMTGSPDADSVINKAVKSRNADGLINMEMKETVYPFILFSIATLNIEGEAVSFNNLNNESKMKGKK